MTGRWYPFWDSVPALERSNYDQKRLSDANLTLAEALRDLGYETYGIFTNPHHHSLSGFGQGFTFFRYLKTGKGYASA